VIRVRFESANVPGQTEELPTELSDRILALTYNDKARGADTCKLTVDNADMSMIDEPRFAEGQKLIVQWGYPHQMSAARKVEIKTITGWLQLSISCVDDGAATSIAHARSQSWPSATEYEVAAEIARRLGFRAEDSTAIEEPAGTIRRPITQAAETDAAFLNRLADRVDAVFRISGGRFYFRPQALAAAPAFVFTYRSSLRGDFAGHPSLKKGTLGIPGRVTRRGRSTRDRRNVRGSAGNDTDTTRTTLGEETVVRDPGERSATTSPEARAAADGDALFAFLTDQPENTTLDESLPSTADSDAEAQQAAQNRFRRAERRAIEMTWPLVGVPLLTADTVVRGLGFSERIAGNYLVTEVTHNVGKSYVSQCKVKRNAQSRSSAGARSRAAQQRRSLQNVRQQAALDAESNSPVSSTSEWEVLLDSVGAGAGPGASDSAGRVNDEPITNRNLRELDEIIGEDADGNTVVRYRRPGAGGTR